MSYIRSNEEWEERIQSDAMDCGTTSQGRPTKGAMKALDSISAQLSGVKLTEADRAAIMWIIDKETGHDDQYNTIPKEPADIAAFTRAIEAYNPDGTTAPGIQQLIDNVRAWGISRGITGPDGKATLLTQLSKTQEELTETRDAAVVFRYGESNGDPDLIFNELWNIKDGIGDCTVTLILAAELAGLRFEDCLQAAYEEIKGRTGRMVAGQFVKDK